MNKYLLLSLILLAVYFFGQFLLVVYRWDGGDYYTYIHSSLPGLSFSPYFLVRILAEPLYLLLGRTTVSLIISCAFIFFFSLFCAFLINKNIVFLVLLTIVCFPIHTLLSMFPGKDILAYSSFLLAFCFFLRSRYAYSLLFIIISFWVRPVFYFSFVCLLLFSFVEFRLTIRTSLKSLVRYLTLLLLLCLLPYLLVVLLSSQLGIYDVSFNALTERVHDEISVGNSSLYGYQSLPLSLLNLFAPLSGPAFSINYIPLSLENIISLLFSLKLLRLSHRLHLRPLLLWTACGIISSVLFFALYPNITDASRKIFPLYLNSSVFVAFLLRRDLFLSLLSPPVRSAAELYLR